MLPLLQISQEHTLPVESHRASETHWSVPFGTLTHTHTLYPRLSLQSKERRCAKRERRQENWNAHGNTRLGQIQEE